MDTDVRSSRPEPQARNTLLPNLCTSYYNLLVVMVSAELLAIALTLAIPGTFQDWLFRLGYYTLYVQWIAVLCAALLCLMRRHSDQLSSPQAALLSWLIIQGVTLFVGLTTQVLHAHLEVIPPLAGTDLLRAQLISAILSAMLLRYLYVQYLWQQRTHSESEARAEALQNRIRPHFLFNTMNTIAATLHANPQRADELIGRLCELFRASLSNANSTGTLAEELELCHGYLQLEQERLSERLQLEWHVDKLPGRAALPKLTLQPLLENAVYHGIEQLEGGGTISLEGESDGRHIRIHITNPISTHTPVDYHARHNMALENVRWRLRHRFGDAATLKAHAGDEQFHVELCLPLEHEGPDR